MQINCGISGYSIEWSIFVNDDNKITELASAITTCVHILSFLHFSNIFTSKAMCTQGRLREFSF